MVKKGILVFNDLSIGYIETKFQIFCCDVSTLLYTFEKEGKENFFPLQKNPFSCPPFSKVYKKVVEFSFTPTKNILDLVFGLDFGFS